VSILLINSSDLHGGAARAAFRLHKGLQKIGLDSRMLVGDKLSDDPTVLGPPSKFQKGIALMRPTLDSLPLYRYGSKATALIYSVNYLPDGIMRVVNQMNHDIVHLHWLGKGYVNPQTLRRFRKPILWTLHDMWAFTGGCHYDLECGRYQDSCGACPQLESKRMHDLSRCAWNRKNKAWTGINLTIVSPSRWLANCAQQSSLLMQSRVEVIPNGIDTHLYKPVDKKIARQILNLPSDRQLLLFGAIGAGTDRRKGIHHLQAALQKISLSENHNNMDLVCFGSYRFSPEIERSFKTHVLGVLNDDISLALAYAAADVFVSPSVQENLSNTVMESLACGTPCVAFNIGGMSDLIDHQRNGYLAEPFNIEDLSRGLMWVMNEGRRSNDLSRNARLKVEQSFDINDIAARYKALYQQLAAASPQD